MSSSLVTQKPQCEAQTGSQFESTMGLKQLETQRTQTGPIQGLMSPEIPLGTATSTSRVLRIN
jgi:hypothetical protein